MGNTFRLEGSQALLKCILVGATALVLMGLLAACGGAAPETDQIAAQILSTPTSLSNSASPELSTAAIPASATTVPTEEAVAPPTPSASEEAAVPVAEEANQPVELSSDAAGYALRFFGTGKDDLDRVKIPLDAPVNIGAEDFTLEWWLKANPGDNQSGACGLGNDNWITGNIIFDRDIWGAGDYGDYGVSLAGGRIAFGVNNGTAGEGICSTTDIADGRWHHLAVTRRLADGWMGIFVDGQLEAQLDGPDGNINYRLERTSDYKNDPFWLLAPKNTMLGHNTPPSMVGSTKFVYPTCSVIPTISFHLQPLFNPILIPKPCGILMRAPVPA
ncbi:MAG: hypothetical protein HC875_32270 [Anaerolineales bacterium]|nr:hypothetical protein [Anaerolineales bacterium]